MGHIKLDNMARMNTIQEVRYIPRITKPVQSICKHCQHGTQTRVSFKGKEHSVPRPLELVHTCVCLSDRIKELKGELYFLLLTNDFT